jgi:3-phenylpropionate/trans-cinnamate dioxygenase ferredoxin reductase subunit
MTSERGTVIVGGGPAGKAAAEAYRAAGGTGPLTLLTDEARHPYNRPPLSKEYLRGEIQDEELALEEAGWYHDRDIEVVLGAEVSELDLEQGRATSGDGRSWSFDRCLLATGAFPQRPDVPGIDGPAVQTIRRPADADALVQATGDVLIVGSGFIGCEAAASLALRGTNVTVATLEQAPQIERLGEDVAKRITQWLQGHGVELLTGSELVEIEPGPGAGTTARFGNGRESEAALVLLAMGIRRNDELARSAGLDVDDGVPVDASMRSADSRVFAAGDVAFAENGSAQRRLRVQHWGEALNQGEVAGQAMAGQSATWDSAPGFWSTLGDRTLKYAGWGDGWDDVRFEAADDSEAFAAWYGRDGEVVGVCAHERDDEYEAGRKLIEERAPWP